MPYTSRDALNAGRCTFQPRNGGSWTQCHDRAVWADPEPTSSSYTWREKRCDKHLALDKRTAANARRRHGWASDSADRMVAFDAQAAIDAYVAKEQAAVRAQQARFWLAVDAAVASRDIEALRKVVVSR
jgi:hypothetical protein